MLPRGVPIGPSSSSLLGEMGIGRGDWWRLHSNGSQDKLRRLFYQYENGNPLVLRSGPIEAALAPFCIGEGGGTHAG